MRRPFRTDRGRGLDSKSEMDSQVNDRDRQAIGATSELDAD